MSANTSPPRAPPRPGRIAPRALDLVRAPASPAEAAPRRSAARSPFELLRCEHLRLAGLLYRAESAGHRSARIQAFADLVRELDIHDHVEERIFYPALRQEEETRDITLDSYDQHRSVRRLVEELGALDAGDPRWPARLALLSYRLQRHMADEEQRLFAQARITLSRTRLAKLAARMAAERRRLSA